MARINNSTDNPKLLKAKLKDGRYSLYLEYYYGYSIVFNEKTQKAKPL